MSEVTQLFALSVDQHQAGNFALAAQGYAAVLAVEPERADAWHLAGLAAHQAGRSRDGLKFLQQAVQLDGSNPEYFTNLAAVWTALDDPQAAEQAADVALGLNPQFPAAQFRKGVALAAQGRSDESIQWLQAALDGDFNPTATLLELGIVLQSLGNFPEATHALEVSLQLDPDQPSVYFHLSKLVATGDYCFSPEQVLRMEWLLKRAGQESWLVPLAPRICFALGVHWEKQRDADRALEYFTLGNQVTHDLLAGRAEFGLDRRAEIVEGLNAYFTAERVSAWRGWGHPSERPIFVVGVPRSGTTLVEQVLSSHPEVGDAGELPTLEQVVRRWSDCWTNPETARELQREEVWAAAEEYLQALAKVDATSKFVVDKMPDNSLYIGFIRLLFPRARIISCRRDPRDIGVSCFGLLFKSDRLKYQTSTWELIGEGFRLHRQGMRHWERLYGDVLTDVFYEHLTSEPDQEIRRLISALGLSWSDACLRHAERTGSVRTASVAQVRQPIYRTSQQRWRRFGTRVEPLIEALGETILEFETALAQARSAGG